jgi:hypothetical protein
MTPMRRACLFKERDVRRLAKAARAEGLQIARIEIDKFGKIVVVTAEQPAGHRGGECSDGNNKPDETPEELMDLI